MAEKAAQRSNGAASNSGAAPRIAASAYLTASRGLANGDVGLHPLNVAEVETADEPTALGGAAISCVEAAPGRKESRFALPADWGDGHFVGVVQVLERVCVKSGLKGVTPHVLQHTFASVAGDLGFSELTIAGLLGHSARGVTQGYLHLDAALGVAADRVSAEIEKMLDGRGAAKKSEENDREECGVLSGSLRGRPR